MHGIFRGSFVTRVPVRRRKKLEVYGQELLSARSEKPGAEQRRQEPEAWNWKPHDPAGAKHAVGMGLWPGNGDCVQTNYAPGKHRQHVVLVFNTGWLTDGLLRWLEERDLPYFYLDFDELPVAGTVSLTTSLATPQIVRVGAAVLDLRDVAAVLWAVPNHATMQPRASAAAKLYVARWKQFLRDLRGMVRPDALWLCSHPLNGSQEWQNKWSETMLALRLGLHVPPAICTSDPEVAHAFVKAAPGRVFFREWSELGALVPLQFVPQDCTPADFARVRPSPCIFQHYVEKAFEVRAVRVGRRVFACKIDSQASPQAAVDWRVYDNANVAWSRIELPRPLVNKLLRFADALDLSYCSFDLIRGTDGLWYFLEANRPGATYWLLPFVGLDIPKELVLLIERRLSGLS